MLSVMIASPTKIVPRSRVWDVALPSSRVDKLGQEGEEEKSSLRVQDVDGKSLPVNTPKTVALNSLFSTPVT